VIIMLFSLIGVALSGIFDNHLWRIVLSAMVWQFADDFGWTTLATTLVSIVAILNMPMYVNLISKLPRKGCVLVTGCDSGMGRATVVSLAKGNTTTTSSSSSSSSSYDCIFAACFDVKTAREEYEKLLSESEMKCVTLVPLNVADAKSVEMAVKTVADYLQANKTELTGLAQFHGIAYNGPAQYMPMEMYKKQHTVNFLGTVRVVQACLGMLRAATSPARIVLTGTGGGPCTPCPPLLTAYMSSKFALEAYGQALRQELYMLDTGIELSIINPGFVKPTMLMEHGEVLTKALWKACPEIAKKEFGPLLAHFITYSSLQPGTHVSQVSVAAEHALLSPVPRSSYKVGIDSKLAPIVGMMPTGIREKITRHGIYGVLSPAGTVKGYKV
jgi:NAD(P)-dependent dehydrogenase (short-subunit alcohol dehydrogenase family)